MSFGFQKKKLNNNENYKIRIMSNTLLKNYSVLPLIKICNNNQESPIWVKFQINSNNNSNSMVTTKEEVLNKEVEEAWEEVEEVVVEAMIIQHNKDLLLLLVHIMEVE